MSLLDLDIWFRTHILAALPWWALPVLALACLVFMAWQSRKDAKR